MTRDEQVKEAERRVIDAAVDFVDAGYNGDDDDAEWTALYEAVRSLREVTP